MSDSGDVFDERFNFRLEIPGPETDEVEPAPDALHAPTPARARGRRSLDGWRVPEGLTVSQLPPLRHPVLLFAFGGWNDAGEAATTAAKLIVAQRDNARFAWVDPEEFFVYSETRPTVRPMRKGGRRQITWPAIEFYSCLDPSDSPEARDLVVIIGTEPDLRWGRFADAVLDLAKHIGVELVVGLGSLNTDIPHSAPVHVSRSATNPDRHPLLRIHRFPRSNYRGPTGIVGVLASRLGDRRYPVLSLWGHAPHYISASPNPVIASKILREVVRLVGLPIDLTPIDVSAKKFGDQVREAVARDPEAAEYVRELERQYRDARQDDDDDTGVDTGDADQAVGGEELPSGAAMVDAIEQFLRFGRPSPESGPTGE